MPQSHSKYQDCWEVEFKFLKVGSSECEARCIDCNSVFLVKNGGHSDVIKHVNGKRHKKIQEQNCVISRNVNDNSIKVNEGKDINNNNKKNNNNNNNNNNNKCLLIKEIVTNMSL